MTIITTNGYKIPELEDKDFWDSYNYNIARLDGHNHTGTDSELVPPQATLDPLVETGISHPAGFDGEMRYRIVANEVNLYIYSPDEADWKKTSIFDDVSPMTTGGDLIYGGVSGTGTRLSNGTVGQILTSAGGTDAPTWESIGAGSGNVVGPVSATDNALARFDLTTGKLLQNGSITEDDSGNLAGVGTLNTHTVQGGSGTLALTSDITGTNSGTNTGDEVAASPTVAGVSELATIAEIDTGTDAVRTITPAGLAGSQLQADVGTNTTNNTGSATVHSDIAAGDITNLGNLSGTNTGDQTFDGLSPLTTGGDLLYGAASGVGTRLANGSAAQVLTSAGGTAPPTWETPGGGGTTVEVTGADTTPGNLDDKIVAGLGAEKTVLTPGGNEQLEIKMSDPYLAIQSTGLLSGGLLSVGGTTGTFDITIGTGVYVANSASPPVTIQDVSISARTNEVVTDILTQLVTYIQIDKDDNIIQTGTFPTAENRRDNIFLGVVVHSDNVNVNVVNNLQSTAYDTTAQMHDISNALGFFNLAGNVISPNGVNLNLNKSAGSGFKDGANFENNRKDPSTLTLAGLVAMTFRYRNQDSTEGSDLTLLDPTTYDNAGTTTAVPANNNATIQRIYIFPSNIMRIQRGQEVFATFSAALDSVGKEPFVTEQNISENGLLLASIVTKKNTTDLSDTAESLVFTATRFGELGSVGSSSIGTLQQTYMNSISPQITTTLGAMTYKAGETDPDIVVEVINAADAIVASITGEGDLAIADIASTGDITVTGTVDGIDIATDVAANTAKVSADGLVTTHSDVTGAGSGIIISAAERTAIGTNTTNNAGSATVHSDIAAGDITNLGNLSGTNTGDQTFDDLSPMTTGADLIYGGASGTGTRLANGTVGQVLTSAGTTVAPTWETPSGGGSAGLGDGSGTAAMVSQNITSATDAVATNTNSIAIGGTASCAGSGGVAVGFQSSAVGTNCLAVGSNAVAASFNSIAFGASANAADRSTAIGPSAKTGFNSVSIGLDSGNGSSTHSVWIGTESGQNVTQDRNVAIGQQAGKNSTGDDCVYLGHTAGVSNLLSDRLIIQNTTDITTPLVDGTFASGGTAAIKLNSTLTIVDGSEGTSGHVWTSSGTGGLGTWAAIATSDPFHIDDTGTRSMTILEEQNVSFSGVECTFYGTQAGLDNTTGDHNTLYGHNCDLFHFDDNDSTGMGHDVIVRERGVGIGAQVVADGVQPTAVGQAAVCSGNNGVAIGITAAASGNDVVAIGATAGRTSGGGDNCVLIGKGAGLNATGNDNVFLGNTVGASSTGARNVVIGKTAGNTMTTGSDNIWIGYQCGLSTGAVSDRLIIENSSDVTTPLINGQFASEGGTRAAFVNINGRFQTSWVSATAAFTAIAGDKILADTATTAAFTVTLPVGVDGDEVSFADSKNNWGTDNLTIARAGSDTIIGGATTLVLSTNDAAVKLVFFGTEWITAP